MRVAQVALLGMALEASASPLQTRQAPAAYPAAGSSGGGGLSSLLGGLSGGSSGGLLSKLGGGGSGGLSSLLSSFMGSGGGGMNPLSMLGDLTGAGGANDIKSGGACKKAALIFARGTGDPGGNMGFVVGPTLARAVRGALGNDIAVQGTDYTANFMGGGADVMAKHVKDYAGRCPNAKFILSGYSQGAMQVHGALPQLGALASKVAAIVTFGDPYGKSGFGGASMGSLLSGGLKGAAGGASGFNPANGLTFCNTGDPVCGLVPGMGGSTAVQSGGGAGHTGYRTDQSIPKAVQFIKTKIQ